jgi:Isocitrate/isopropylmalate dehydrogenase
MSLPAYILNKKVACDESLQEVCSNVNAIVQTIMCCHAFCVVKPLLIKKMGGFMATFDIAVMAGDGIGVDVTQAALHLVDVACVRIGGVQLNRRLIEAGARYYKDHGRDIMPGGEHIADVAHAIFVGAIGLPQIRADDGTEIAPHLRMRERYGLYAGVRPVKAYQNIPLRLSDQRAESIDFVILRESTEGLFYTAAVHGRGQEHSHEEATET